MSKKSDSLVEEIQDFIWRENPVEATMVGVHRYDDRLEKLDVVSRKNKLKRKEKYLEQIKKIEKSGELSDELAIIRDALEVGIRMEEELQSLDRDAGTYPRLAIYGVYQLIARSSEPFHYRALRAIDRMREIPRLLSEGKLNLTYGVNIPHLWTQAAIEMTIAGRDCLARLTALLIEKVPELGKGLQKYTGDVLEAFDEYLEFLVNEVEPRSNGNFSVGRELFNFLLNREHKLKVDDKALGKMARREAEKAAAGLERMASGMEGPDDWRLQLDRIKAGKPDTDLLDFWNEIIGQVRHAVEQADLVSLPECRELKIISTPVFEQATIPQAGYIPAPPLEAEGQAFFCVTPPSVEDEDDQAQESNGSYSRHQALLKVIHELYPGRHTLLSVRNEKCPGAALLTRHNVLEDGWCSYVCELLPEKKLLNDPDLQLLTLHEGLIDAHRVLADIGLHCGQSDQDQAVNELVRGSGISMQAARFEVRKLACSPTASVGALLGRLEIKKLFREYKKKKGKKSSLKEFHDSLLKMSWYPLTTVRSRLLN